MDSVQLLFTISSHETDPVYSSWFINCLTKGA